MTSKNGVVQTSNEANQLLSSTDGLLANYDNNGNMISKTKDGVAWTYSWNSSNQLTQASSSDGTVVVFAYDALGKRISKTSNGTTIEWIYDGNDILLEYQNSILTSHYTHGSNIDEPLVKSDVTTGSSYYYHADGLGSIVSVIDSLGDVVESYRYSSFGVPTIFNGDGEEIAESAINNPFLFTSREFDSETNLYYYRDRYYDASLGIFVSKDPIGFDDGPNRYSYVHNNPINFTDPFGLKTKVHVQYKLTKIVIIIIEEDECLGLRTTTKFEIRANPLGFTAQIGGMMGVGYAGVEARIKGDQHLLDASVDVGMEILNMEVEIEDISPSESGGGGDTKEY